MICSGSSKKHSTICQKGQRRYDFGQRAPEYGHDLLAYCKKANNSTRFSRIEFAVSYPVTDAFRNTDGVLWRMEET
jgi:hypothetical protein